MKKKYVWGGLSPDQYDNLSKILQTSQNIGSLGGIANAGMNLTANTIQNTGGLGQNNLLNNGLDLIQNLGSTFKKVKNNISQNVSKGLDVASAITAINENSKNKQREQKLYSESLLNTPWNNSNGVTNNQPVYAKYGRGDSNNIIEAEKGEVYEDNGEVYKIPDNEKSHAEGGVDIEADRVLENAATRYKTELADKLKITPDQALNLFDIKINKAESHASVFDKGIEKISKIENNVNSKLENIKNSKTTDKYMLNSLKLNEKLTMGSIPTRNELFDKLFEHQEGIKLNHSLSKNKAKYGIDTDPKKNKIPYIGVDKTPTGMETSYDYSKNGLPKDYANQWSKTLGKDYNTNSIDDVRNLQQASYDWYLKNDPKYLKTMWADYGNTDQGKKLIGNNNYDFKNLTNDQLNEASSFYADSNLGKRTLPIPSLNYAKSNLDFKNIPTNLQNSQLFKKINLINNNSFVENKDVVNNNVNNNSNTDDNFKLKWNDISGSVGTILSSLNREPEYLNSVNLPLVSLQQQDYRPLLNANEADYQAARSSGNSSVSAATNAQLFSNKMRVDNQAIGQVQANNTQIRNQQEIANNEIKAKQELMNAQNRGDYYNRVLTSKAKQQEQLLTGIESLSNKILENKAFNANAKLLMKFAPNFDQNADYNGKQTVLSNGSSNSSDMVPYRTKNANGKETVTYIPREEYNAKLNKYDLRNFLTFKR